MVHSQPGQSRFGERSIVGVASIMEPRTAAEILAMPRRYGKGKESRQEILEELDKKK